MLRCILLLCILLALPTVAHADRRVALVIGNGDYARVGKLPNPTRDADAVETLLRSATFDVVEARRNLGVAAMRRALRDFSDHARDADIAVVFYAGHGIEVNGTNYLIPVDAALERDIDVEDETVPLERVVQVLERVKRLRLVILDACRDNPFARSMKRTLSGRSIGRGLAKVEVLTSDTLVAFAAKAGSTASDGEGTNSPYTSALLHHLMTPGLDLRLALGRVRDEVLKNTGNRQEPFVYGSLGGAEIALAFTATVQPQGAPSPVPAQPQTNEVERAWVLSKDTTSIAVLEAFAARFKGTFYADLARARIEELRRQQVAVATPVPPPAAKPGPPPSTPAAPSSAAAWVKLCERSNSGSTSCATHHERLDGKTGMTVAAAALSDADQGGRRRLQVLVPLGMALQPGMRVTAVPNEIWEKVQRNEKLDKADEARLSPASITYRLCDPAGCRGETDVSTQLLEQMRNAGGLFVDAVNSATGAPVTMPIPLNGFNSALAGPPTDNHKYQEAREALFRKFNTTSRPPALSAVASYAPATPPAPRVALKQPTPMGGWVKMCDNVASKDKDGKDVRRFMCLTHYERLDPSGVTQISAAVRQVEGFDKQHMMVSVPLGVLLQPSLRATVYPRDAWNKLLNGEHIADTKSEFLTYTICHPAGCTAELEATPQVLDQIRAGGGMMVTATAPSGHSVTYPVPFAGFSEAHAGTPVDGTRYAAERQALLDRISKSRQK
jgi:uncharacterized caspase-like protein